MYEESIESKTGERPEGVINVFYASDGGDYDRLEASAWSVRRFFGDRVRIFVLTECYWGPSVGGATLVNPCGVLRDVGFFPMGWGRHMPFSVLYRLAIPLLRETEGIDAAVYLDTDTLVQSDDALRELAAIVEAPSDFEVFGAPDVGSGHDMSGRNKDVVKELSDPTAKELHRLWGDRDVSASSYVNGGVLVFNLKKIRDNGLAWYRKRLSLFWDEQLLGKFHFLDQDFINVMMDVSPSLDRRLNVIGSPEGRNALIRHFAGNGKKAFMDAAISLGYHRNAAASAEMPVFDANIPGSSQMILFISHIVNGESIYRYRKLKEEAGRIGMKVLWCCNYQRSLPEFQEDIVPFMISDSEIQKLKKYTFKLHDYGVLHSAPAVFAMECHKALKEKLEYIWCIEYDACYSGDWGDFFRSMNRIKCDLIAEKITSRYQEDGWMWWRQSPLHGFHWKHNYKCLNCVSRLSTRLLTWLSDLYDANAEYDNCGMFYEKTWPSVAIRYGSAYDIYHDYCIEDFSFSKCSTSRIRPNRLYHAVKLDVHWNEVARDRGPSLREESIGRRLISAVSAL